MKFNKLLSVLIIWMLLSAFSLQVTYVLHTPIIGWVLTLVFLIPCLFLLKKNKIFNI